jgi:sugar phosphate isomerase/epimerase
MKVDARVLSCGTMLKVDTETYLRAAADAGFDAVSLRPAQIGQWVDAGGTLVGLRHRLDQFDLAVAEIDPIMAWAPGAAPNPPHAPQSSVVLEMAEALGAHAVSALVAPDHHLVLDRPAGAGFDATVEAFAALCDAAAARGVVVQLEFFGWSALHTLGDAMGIVSTADRPNGGVLIDTWHHARRDGTVADVDAVDPARVVALQIADGPIDAVDADLAIDNRHRAWPACGEQHPERIIHSLRRRGWQGPIGVEVFGDASADPTARAHRAMASLTAVVDAR